MALHGILLDLYKPDQAEHYKVAMSILSLCEAWFASETLPQREGVVAQTIGVLLIQALDTQASAAGQPAHSSTYHVCAWLTPL